MRDSPLRPARAHRRADCAAVRDTQGNRGVTRGYCEARRLAWPSVGAPPDDAPGEGTRVSEQDDRTGLSIFDNAATGGFHVRSRGYDRDQVERYVRKIEDQLNAARARSDDRGELLERAEARVAELSAELNTLKGRLSDAEAKLRNVEQPSFAGLGDHVAGLLKSAEEQSATLVQKATADAEKMRAEAAAGADKTRSDADRYSRDTRTAADTYSDDTRTAADAYSKETRDAADDDAATTRREANQDATAARVAAVDEAKAMLAELKDAVAAIRADADRDADEQREAAATLLHEARQRADHSVGAVTAALGTIGQRLSADGFGGHRADTSGRADSGSAAAPADDDVTQLIPAADGS